MEIKLEVNESQFKEILDDHLKNLSEEKIMEIIYECIRTYLNNHPEVIKSLFVESNRWGYNEGPTVYLRSIIKEHISPETFKETADEVINTLKTNHDKILRDAFIDLLIGGMFDSYRFQDRMRETLRQISTQDQNSY